MLAVRWRFRRVGQRRMMENGVMLKSLKSAAMAAFLAAGLFSMAAPAQADDRWRDRDRGGDDAAIAIGAGLVGLAIGAAIADSDDDHYYDRDYYRHRRYVRVDGYPDPYYYYDGYPNRYYRDRYYDRDYGRHYGYRNGPGYDRKWRYYPQYRRDREYRRWERERRQYGHDRGRYRGW